MVVELELVVVVVVVVQEERQEDGSWVMASLNSMRALAWACTTAMSSLSEEEDAGEGASGTASTGSGECMIRTRMERM